MLDRMSTMDQVSRSSHGVDTTCVLCKNDSETRDHLFFECAFLIDHGFYRILTMVYECFKIYYYYIESI